MACPKFPGSFDSVGAKQGPPKSPIRGYIRNRITSNNIAIICQCDMKKLSKLVQQGGRFEHVGSYRNVSRSI